MARNIKQVSHDLMPIINTICNLGQEVNAMLATFYATLEFKNAKEREHFEVLISALDALNASGQLAQQYIQEVDDEAEQEGINKG